MTREEQWKHFVAEYRLEPPEKLVENEMNRICMSLRHKMQYDALTGSGVCLFPEKELEMQMNEIRDQAYFAVKEELVMKEMIKEHGFTAEREELEAEALELAARQELSPDMVKEFFGENLSLLENSVLERKVLDWVWEN